MPNIPRRKIYEYLLKFEDGLIDLQIALQNRDDSSYLQRFNEHSFQSMHEAYQHVKGLLVVFLRNDAFSDHEQYETIIEELVNDEAEANKVLENSKTLSQEFKESLKEVDELFSSYEQVPDITSAESLYHAFERFNHQVPKLLELSREEIRD